MKNLEVRRQRNLPTRFDLFACLLSCIMAALILFPLISVFWTSFFPDGAFSGIAFRELTSQAGLGGVLLNSFLTIGVATALATLVGTVFAGLTERTDMGLNSVGRLLPTMPLLVPPIAGAIGWVMLAAPRSGFLNAFFNYSASWFGVELRGPFLNIFSWPGLIFVYAVYLVPHVYLTVAAGLRNLDPSLEEAARVSGASSMATIVGVTIPAVMPAVASGAILALISGVALFSVPIIIGGQAGIEILSVRIVHLMTASYPPQTGQALLLGLLVAGVVSASWLWQRRLMRAGNFATIGGRARQQAVIRLGWLKWPARLLVMLYVLIASVLPLAALFIVSLQPFWSPKINSNMLSMQHYVRLFGQQSFAYDGLFNSVVLGIIAATSGTFVAAVIAYYVDRNQTKLISLSIDAVTKLPAAVSHLIIGIAFVAAFAGAPFYLHGTLAILLLAYIVLYAPQATFSAGSALSQVGRQLMEASLVCGASSGATFARITLPLMLPGLMAGWTMLFVLVAGDITASSMLAGTRNPVAGFVILDLWTNGAFPPLAAFATVISLTMSAVVLFFTWLETRYRRSSRSAF